MDKDLFEMYYYDDTEEDIIFCIVGASGSGKSTIVYELIKENPQYNKIHSYTTRPERYKDEWGHTFIKDFSIEHKNDDLIMNVDGNIISKNNDTLAHVVLYGEHYFATHEQYQGKGISFYVVDPVGAIEVTEKAQNARVVTVYLQTDKLERQTRLLNRYQQNDNKNEKAKYENVTLRLDNDDKVFDIIKCDYVVNANDTIDEVVKKLEQIVDREVK